MNDNEKFPIGPVTLCLLAANLLFFVATHILKGSLGPEWVRSWLALQPEGFCGGRVWTILTYMFVHINWIHLLFNMCTLMIFCSCCEGILGKATYLIVYLFSGMIAGGISAVCVFAFGGVYVEAGGGGFWGMPLDFYMGASGALFAMMTMFMVLTPREKLYIVFFPFFELRAYIIIPLGLCVMFLYYWVFPESYMGPSDRTRFKVEKTRMVPIASLEGHEKQKTGTPRKPKTD